MKQVILALLLLGASRSVAQDSTASPATSPLQNNSSTRKILASGILAGMIGTSTIWAVDAWWQGRARPFNFYSEGWFNDYSLGMDKAGHVFTSYFYYHTFRNVMLWGGFDPETAFWWGAGLAEFLALSLELGDGFSTFGFSYEDLLANTSGLAFGMLQTKIPLLRNFSLKWSYIPVGVHHALNFTQHYDEHTYWLSCNINGLLPGDWKAYWPKFLQVAIGYSTKTNQTRREAVVGLDFNLEVFPAASPEVLLVEKTFNMFHIPAPGVKFSEHQLPRYRFFHLN